jgi:hypothetical protein
MAPTTPNAVFADAGAAMERGDWKSFFACMDGSDLARIASNSVKGLLGREDPGFLALCSQYSFPAEALDKLRDLAQEMTRSSQEFFESQRSVADPNAAMVAMAEHSRRQRDKVNEYDGTLKRALKSVPDLPGLTAGLERRMREVVGGGSVACDLFVNETLEDIVIEGTKAWAVRVMDGGYTEDVGFVQRRGGWYIQLMARRPRRLLGTRDPASD